MTPEEFVKYLTGYVEITGGKFPSEQEWARITGELEKVFNKVTLSFGVLNLGKDVNGNQLYC